jgi:hypothetical protein
MWDVLNAAACLDTEISNREICKKQIRQQGLAYPFKLAEMARIVCMQMKVLLTELQKILKTE